jgi:phosphohistidine phosphatase
MGGAVRLLIVRHAIAADPEPGMADEDRPLTPEGVRKWKEAAAGLATILDPPDVLLTSPWRRALHTAEILGEAWGGREPEPTAALTTGRFEELAAVIDGHREARSVAVVGHEPWLSALLARLVGTPDSERLAFKKGGAALVELPAGLLARGSLLWFLPPRLLRALDSD